MVLQKISDVLDIVARPLTRALKGGAMVVLAAMMYLTAADVLLRYVFNSPIPGGYEIIEFMMGIVIPFALVYTASQKAHIGVDLIVERLPERFQKIIATITTCMTFILFLLIAWQGYYYIFEEIESRLTSSVLLIPVWPFLIIYFLSAAILSLVVLVDAMQRLAEVGSKWTRSS